MHYGIILVIQGHLRVRKVIYKVQNKIAARYFKVKYDFSTNEARNKCNTSFSCDFDWAIRFLYYFYDSRSSARSKSPLQGQISQNTVKPVHTAMPLGQTFIPVWTGSGLERVFAFGEEQTTITRTIDM